MVAKDRLAARHQGAHAIIKNAWYFKKLALGVVTARSRNRH